jgi:hypothetical protein
MTRPRGPTRLAPSRCGDAILAPANPGTTASGGREGLSTRYTAPPLVIPLRGVTQPPSALRREARQTQALDQCVALCRAGRLDPAVTDQKPRAQSAEKSVTPRSGVTRRVTGMLAG